MFHKDLKSDQKVGQKVIKFDTMLWICVWKFIHDFIMISLKCHSKVDQNVIKSDEIFSVQFDMCECVLRVYLMIDYDFIEISVKKLIKMCVKI